MFAPKIALARNFMMIERKSVRQFIHGLRREELHQCAVMNVKELMLNFWDIKYGREMLYATVVTFIINQ